MASVGAEHDEQIQEWMKGFKELPEDRQDNIFRWFATQKIIIENSGLEMQEWFAYIEWAMDNPFDYAFINDFPDMPEHEVGADAAERADGTKQARALVGGAVAVTGPTADGPGLKDKAKAKEGLERELFDRFMQNRR